MIELMASIEDATDAEKQALVDRLSEGTSMWDELDQHRDRATQLRARLLASRRLRKWTRDDVVTAINYAETTRLLMHLTLSIIGPSVERLQNYIKSGRCAYCEWTYRDASFDVPATREVTDAEIAGVNERVSAAIREHVKVCEKHPMRELEREISILAFGNEPPDDDEDDSTGDVAQQGELL